MLFQTYNIFLIISPAPNRNLTERVKEQQAKFGRPSLYSMFSLIDENDENNNLSYFEIIRDIFSNIVKFYFIKARFISSLYWQFVVSYLL